MFSGREVLLTPVGPYNHIRSCKPSLRNGAREHGTVGNWSGKALWENVVARIEQGLNSEKNAYIKVPQLWREVAVI